MTTPSDKAARDLKSEFVERRQSAREQLTPLGESSRSTNILAPLIFSTNTMGATEQFSAWKKTYRGSL
ncbi:hypothetical protein [Brucella pituitosa]|uniref:hypothetical protein n=1 Tax=Brucella pituitosa TaxID=571256 RepID=UPI0020922874|nr:hypothetical protein [Brucella pituitosa]